MPKKLISFFVTSIAICLLFSCDSKRNSVIATGYYFGVDSRDSTISCELFISKIPEDDFWNANGINVVDDGINGIFYSLNCIVRLPNNDVKFIDFIHLKDAHDSATGTPISYVDDNDNWLTPFTSMNGEPLSSQDCYYSINLNSYDFDLFAYLYFQEG